MARRTRNVVKSSEAPELDPVGSDSEPDEEFKGGPEPDEEFKGGPEPLARLDIDDVTFETIQQSPQGTLARICNDNGLNPVGTQADLASRLRSYKMSKADRRREDVCGQCGGIGTRLSGPRTTSHAVSRPFKCTRCGKAFTTRQDTRKAGAR